MKRSRIRPLTWVLASVVVVLIIVVLAGHFWLQVSAISTARDWARLAPFPATAHDQKIDVEGSPFTREFIISFTAPPDDVRKWISASPGPASATRSADGGITVYSITPGDGADFAEVRVDEKTGRVIIHTYWS